MIGSKQQKQIEAGLIHWPHRINTSWHATEPSRFRDADPSDGHQKIDNSCLESKLLHCGHTLACSGSWLVKEHSVSRGNIETAGPCSRPKIFLCPLPVFAVDVADDDDSPTSAVDLTGDGKLGYGFTSADDLEEVDIGPGDKPRPTFISKKLDPNLHEPMIALKCLVWIEVSSNIGSRLRKDFGRFNNEQGR